MSDDIVFIKDENDYVEYSKLRPKRKYRNKKVKYICRQCGKVKFINFHRLDKNFICPYCRSQNTRKSEYKIIDFDRIDTEEELRYYKSLRPQAPYLYRKIKFQCTKCKHIKTRNFVNFKIDNFPFLCNECKLKQTCGSQEHKEKLKATMISRYGVDNIQKSKEHRQKRDKTEQLHLVEKYNALIPEQVLDYDYHYYTCHCPICDNTFKIEKDLFYTRVITHKTTVCTFCNPVSRQAGTTKKLYNGYLRRKYRIQRQSRARWKRTGYLFAGTAAGV